MVAADKWIAHFQGAHLHDDRGGGTAPGFHLRFDDRAARLGRGRGFQVHDLGLQEHHLQELLNVCPFGGGHRNGHGFAAPIFRSQILVLQLLLDAVDIGARQVNLVDGHHDFHVRSGLGVIDGLDRLRHEPVVRGHDQDNNVRHRGSARAHGRKSGVARRIEESDGLPFVFHPVGADVLGNPAGFARRHPRLADRIHERRFAVIDVSHKRNDGRAELELLFLFDNGRRRRHHHLFDLVHASAFEAHFFFEHESVALGNLRGDVRLDRLVDVGENVKVHQLGNELMSFQSQFDGQLAHDNGRFDMDDVLRLFLRAGGNGLRFRRGDGCFRHRLGFGRFRRPGRDYRRLERSANAGNRRKNGGLSLGLTFRRSLLRRLLVDQGNALHVPAGDRHLGCWCFDGLGRDRLRGSRFGRSGVAANRFMFRRSFLSGGGGFGLGSGRLVSRRSLRPRLGGGRFSRCGFAGRLCRHACFENFRS